MKSQAEKNIDELIENRDPKELVRFSFSEIKLTRKSMPQYAFCILVSVPLSIGIGWHIQTVEIFQNVIELFNGIELAFIAMILGSYAIFQALMTDNVIKLLVESKNNLLNESNKSFLRWVILYLTSILINVVMAVVLMMIPKNFILFENVIICNVVASCLLFIYFLYNMLVVTELKNFAVNLYKMFNVYNIVRALEVENEDEE